MQADVTNVWVKVFQYRVIGKNTWEGVLFYCACQRCMGRICKELEFPSESDGWRMTACWRESHYHDICLFKRLVWVFLFFFSLKKLKLFLINMFFFFLCEMWAYTHINRQTHAHTKCRGENSHWENSQKSWRWIFQESCTHNWGHIFKGKISF